MKQHGLDGRPVEKDPFCWERCLFCENYWCAIHAMHAHDCDCPSIEEWAQSPYTTRTSEVKL